MQFVTQAVWLGRHFPSHTSPIKMNENHSFQYFFYIQDSCYGIQREANSCLWNYNDEKEKEPFMSGSGEG